MKFRLVVVGLLAVLFLASCSHYNKMLKSRDYDAKLEYAVKLYNKGDYFKALPLLEELITVYRGTKKAEQTYYYYAYTNYRIGDYETAAYDFDNFTKTYSSSEFAEECAFMHAYCYYESSPLYSLDQSNTQKAINELQLYIDRYPQSKKIDECNTLIDKLREKLERKDFEIADLYFHTDAFKAAVTCYKNILHDYPATKYREEVMFKIVKASYLLAEGSVDEKKVERYNATLTAYAEFANAFPTSKWKDKADDVYQSTQKRLEKLTNKLVQK
ncbi:MAG: outer membrane protein assembly factor BamD [Bacteroidetes bacterium]|nr:outer membrane protein assembly factor BamD [Bacteroidota bacterium]